MTPTVRLCLVLHNHQPIGNFDGVFEDAYNDSYKPFLDVFEPFTDLQIALHTSGPLFEWLEEKHPEYFDRVAELVAAGRIEIVGGAYYEPILTMIPSRDRVGQIETFSKRLQDRLSCEIRGMWTPERVWEQSLAGDMSNAGIQYTVLDDCHFRNAGLIQNQLSGYYVTEDHGRTLKIFPGSEQLRYLLPFQEPDQTINYLRELGEHHPGAVAVFGDDGEKFGTWPDTKAHVYEHGWLKRFFEALSANKEWLKTTTPAEAIDSTPPVGSVYLPDASYREMTEWALPVERQIEYDESVHEFEHDPRWGQLKQFVRGGFWRNFKTKYPESNEMYARMMAVSARYNKLSAADADEELLSAAQQELYKGQCNCSYWHGAFGGIYLPHLRNAVYHHLIAADNLLDQAEGKAESYVEADAADYNFDSRPEIRLTSDRLHCLLSPRQGGQLYELDVRSIQHNLLATIMRRPEAYHRKVLAGAGGNGEDVASIHDRVVFKQEGLDQLLQYDSHARKSLIDHFWDTDASVQAVSRGESLERGDFVEGAYEARIRRNPSKIQVQLTRAGNAWGREIRITKGVTLAAAADTIDIAYKLEGLPQDKPFHFGVELNFAGLPDKADDRFFYNGSKNSLGHFGETLDLQDASELGLVDQWLGIDLNLAISRPTGIWAFPIQTVSQSEGGFELVHQSVVVQPHWLVTGDAEGVWSVTMKLKVDTTMAQSRTAESTQKQTLAPVGDD